MYFIVIIDIITIGFEVTRHKPVKPVRKGATKGSKGPLNAVPDNLNRLIQKVHYRGNLRRTIVNNHISTNPRLTFIELDILLFQLGKMPIKLPN